MSRNRFLVLALAAVVLLAGGFWLNANRASRQSGMDGGKVFSDLAPALGEIGEIRLSKGDGSRTTLRKEPAGWTVVERQYPADPSRVRELVLGMVDMKIVEAKTSDPANYAKLGVEKPDTPTAASTLLEVVAGKTTWSLIVGKHAEGSAIYVRKPDQAASALVEPAIAADPDQKRWIDRQLTDIRGLDVHDISVKPASGPAYVLTRRARGDTDLSLSPVPKGRAAASLTINGQGDGLTAFIFDDLHTAPATPPKAVDRVTFRTFDGQVFEFTGRKDGEKAFVSVTASRDPALAAQFPPPAPEKPAAAATPAVTPAAAPTEAAPEAKPADQTAERVAQRAKGFEYEIPTYKYDALFKPLEELLEPKATAASKPQT